LLGAGTGGKKGGELKSRENRLSRTPYQGSTKYSAKKEGLGKKEKKSPNFKGGEQKTYVFNQTSTLAIITGVFGGFLRGVRSNV